jgi:hypothetical protein
VGCPIQRSQDHSSVTNSPGLIAGSHVFHRLWTPSHSQCALSGLITPTRRRVFRCGTRSIASFDAIFRASGAGPVWVQVRPCQPTVLSFDSSSPWLRSIGVFRSSDLTLTTSGLTTSGLTLAGRTLAAWTPGKTRLHGPTSRPSDVGDTTPVRIRFSRRLVFDGINPAQTRLWRVPEVVHVVWVTREEG